MLVVAKIKAYSAQLGGKHWELSPLLERLAAEGKKISGYSN